MSKFKPSLLTLALISAGLAGTVHAADADKKTDKEKAAEATKKAVETIEVTGFRRSVIQSLNTKRYSSSVVEALSAEDIGKLPDSSIAESIARLPGLAAQRLDGRASRVTIRGFGENESSTTFNGREQVSISDNRGVEFDLYPSEIMSGVTVYKTPDSSLEGEGIAGVIDLQTIKPLSVDERVIQFNGQIEQTGLEKLNPDGDRTGFRGTFSYVDKFADDTVGVAFAHSTMSSPNQENRWNAWGYPEFEVGGNKFSILGGAKPFVRSSTLDRDSTMLVIEASPNDDVHMTFDALYVDFKDTKILRGIEVPFAWGQGSIDAATATVDEATGFVTSAITKGQRVVVRNDVEERKADLTSLGFNTNWTINETWALDADISYSKVKRKIWSIESYAGTGRGNDEGVADDIGYTFDGGNTGAKFTHGLDYSDFDLIQLGGPLTWGWNGALNDKFNTAGTPYENAAQDGFINAPEIDDELMSLKLAATQQIDSEVISDITYGVSHRAREKNKKSEGYYMTLNAFPGTLVVPEEYREGSVSLDFIGMGNMIAYDTQALIDDGYYSLTAQSISDPAHATKSWNVEEKITAAFVKADINAEIGDMPLTGNVGVRYVHTKQSSDGSAFGVRDGKVVTPANYREHSYSNVLPSLNLSLKLDDDQALRFGAAKTLSRARMDDMNASQSATYSQERPDDNGNYWSVSGGNTALEPKEAIGYDFTYENYFSQEGYFSLAYFYKDLSNWIFDGSYEQDMTGVADPATGNIPPADRNTATASGKVNGGGGTLKGWEASITFPFNMISDSLDGLGLIASHTSVSSDIKDQNDNDYELPGLSERIQSFTLYYEKSGFESRVSMRKRSDFKGDVYGIGFDTQQVDILGETIVDAQIGYNFGDAGFENLEGLSIFLQGQNLTDEPFTSLSGDNALQVRDYQQYGRSFLLGFSYKM
ncbi:TonB-dependent receptor [Psychrobium sp. MM17-31]|uniref:TonB-dependent receptor n=1 Tax=Psychrobium sp. MM17-31 TaxID=2917758 RepID=UPI001EF42A09|nr:TonB-dependent receptor [Psychrobium sp. MM17-31]MCG7532411.1 TonB-dependent receptor [Psychrobium sp. MM17-31]